MKKIIEINNKNICIYYEKYENKINIPVVLLNSFEEDGEDIFNKIKQISNKNFILVTISNINWNSEMSPWYMDKLYKNDDVYSGNADEYLNALSNKIVPFIDKTINELLNININSHILAGYSLAGLFSIYSLFKIDIFESVISCSGSLWYPNFIDFINRNELIVKPKKVYLSLGDKENKSKNELMSSVLDKTKEVEKYFKNKNIDTIFELNEGNHFMSVNERIAKGIAWTLESD